MGTNSRKKSVLALDASAKCSIPVVESCASMGLHVIAASHKKYCCGFFCRATNERVVYPSPERQPNECLKFLIDLLQQRDISLIIPMGHFMTEFIARHQGEFRKHTKLVLPSYDIFFKGLNKIQTLKAAEQVGCPTPKTWYPQDEPLEDIARKVTYPVLIKPSVSVGARGLTYCHSAQELLDKFPKTEAGYGECSIQEFIPQTATQYKCAIVVDHNQELLCGIVYAKLRYYPVKGGSSTLDKTVYRPDIMQSSLNVARRLKWFGPCDFDYITDPRDNVAKLMEINPRLSDTYKMAAVAGLDMTRIIYQLAMGQTPQPQLDYQKDKYLRFIFGDIMWFLSSGSSRWKAHPCFFDFFRPDTAYLMTGTRDLGPMLGYFLENISILWDKEARQFRLRRHHG